MKKAMRKEKVTLKGIEFEIYNDNPGTVRENIFEADEYFRNLIDQAFETEDMEIKIAIIALCHTNNFRLVDNGVINYNSDQIKELSMLFEQSSEIGKRSRFVSFISEKQKEQRDSQENEIPCDIGMIKRTSLQNYFSSEYIGSALFSSQYSDESAGSRAELSVTTEDTLLESQELSSLFSEDESKDSIVPSAFDALIYGTTTHEKSLASGSIKKQHQSIIPDYYKAVKPEDRHSSTKERRTRITDYFPSKKARTSSFVDRENEGKENINPVKPRPF